MVIPATDVCLLCGDPIAFGYFSEFAVPDGTMTEEEYNAADKKYGQKWRHLTSPDRTRGSIMCMPLCAEAKAKGEKVSPNWCATPSKSSQDLHGL